MDKKSIYEGKLQKLALSCDSFTTGYFAVSLLFAVWYVYMYGGTLVLGFLPIACLVPFAIMPLVYMLVHRIDTVLFGRYHLAMPLSAFIAALFFVILYSSTSPTAGGACAVFFGALVFVPSVMIYRYCAFSVRARLIGDGIIIASPYAAVFSLVGALGALAAFFAFWHFDPATAFLNTAYVLGGACIVFSLISYLTTYYGIPRLGGRRVQSVKSVFRAFYTGLSKRIYFSTLLFLCAFASVVMIDMLYALIAGLGYWEVFGVAVVFLGCYSVSACACYYKAKRRSLALSIVCLVCFLFGAVTPLVFAAVGTGDVVYPIAVSVALCGVGGAVTVRQAKLRMISVKPHMTSGVVFMLIELTAFAAIAVAFAVCAVTAAVSDGTHAVQSFIYGYAASIVFCIAAFALAGKKSQKSGQAPAPSYELNTRDIDKITAE